MKISYLSVLWCLGICLVWPAPAGASELLRVRATLIELPRSPPCRDRERRAVTTAYRVEKVLHRGDRGAAAVQRGQRLLVVHNCPRIPRGQSRHGKGSAGAMRPGQEHLMTLRPAKTTKKLLDRYVQDRGPRYRAVTTDPAPQLPRIVVIVTGGAGARYRLNFDAESVSVGRDHSADVLLSQTSVKRQHLLLVVQGDRISVRPRGRAAVQINGKPVHGATKITFKDRITVGSYLIRAALFLPAPNA